MTRVLLALVVIAAPALARTSLGSFGAWAAFRDESPWRCFAIAEPGRGHSAQSRPFASVATWPQAGARGQFYARLGRERRPGTTVTLTVDDRKFALIAGTIDAWAPDARSDAAIVAAMRSAQSMSITSIAQAGRAFTETYQLKGAATAIDAAALGCARR